MYHRCDCDRQALMTALDTCHWFRAECFLLNTDLGSVSDASASALGSISAGSDEDEENDKIVVEDDGEDFCTYLNGRAVTKRGELNLGFYPPPGRTAPATGQTSLKPLQCHWNAADMKLL